jgi:DNA repair protein RecO (recombination protein O)
MPDKLFVFPVNINNCYNNRIKQSKQSMPQIFQSNGIIIKEEESGEHNRFLTVFTENFGKIKLHAIGSRKITSKLAGRLALFNLVDIYFVRGQKRNIITDAYVINNFFNIKNNLIHFKTAFRISGIVDNLAVESEMDGRLWTIITWIFDMTDKEKISNESSLLLRLFEIKMLEYMGHLPDFRNNNPHNFRSGIQKILTILSYDYQNIPKIVCSKKDLYELKQATDLMLNMVY